jgi:hypothetical protein
MVKGLSVFMKSGLAGGGGGRASSGLRLYLILGPLVAAPGAG